jgi:hypothetical protein
MTVLVEGFEECIEVLIYVVAGSIPIPPLGFAVMFTKGTHM